MRAVAVLLVALLLAVGLGAFAGFFLLADLPADDREWRPLVVPALNIAPFVGAFLVAALGFVMLSVRQQSREKGAPVALVEAEKALDAGRLDDAHLALRRACENLRGDRPTADATHVSEVARVALKLAGDAADADLRNELRAIVDAPLPVEPGRLSLLLAYVDAHADAVASRAQRADEVAPAPTDTAKTDA